MQAPDEVSVQAPDEELGGGEDDSQVLGSIIGGYLVCMVCCTTCCVVGAGSLLWSGTQCLSQPPDDNEACSRAGAYAMIVFGSLPLVFAVAAQVYLQADARGWFRPATVLPGTALPPPCMRCLRPSSDCGISIPPRLLAPDTGAVADMHTRACFIGGHGARRLAKLGSPSGMNGDGDESLHAPLTFETEGRGESRVAEPVTTAV